MVGTLASRPGGTWSPARIFLAISAGYHLLLGIVGLAIDHSFPVGRDATLHAGGEHVFGIFETNGWHSLAAILLGVVSFYFAARPLHARRAAFLLGLSQLGVALVFAVFPPSTFSFASNGADQVIHSLTALGGIASALLTPASAEQRV